MVGLRITSSLKSKLRSLNSYYCHNVLGKKKSFSLRKTNKQVTLIENFVSYDMLKCNIGGTNNQLRNRFCKLLHLQLFNAKYKFVQFELFDVKFLFPENISSASKRELLFMDALLQFRVLKSLGKMMTCYLRDKNKFLRYCTLCTSILKCRFSTKGIELTWLILFEAVEIPQIQAPRFSPF